MQKKATLSQTGRFFGIMLIQVARYIFIVGNKIDDESY